MIDDLISLRRLTMGALALILSFIALPAGVAAPTPLAAATGTFVDSGQALGSANSEDVALGDLDGDGDLDAFVANYNAASTVWVNQGAAQAGTPGVFADGGQALGSGRARSVALADLDADNDLDAFVVLDFGPVTNQIWLNQGGSQGGQEGQFALNGQGIGDDNGTAVALGDLDGDGDLDAFISRFLRPDRVWLNDGAGLFASNGQDLGNDNGHDVALGDVDGDGDLDAFVAHQGADKVWLNDGAGAFSDSGQSLAGITTSNAVALGAMQGPGSPLDAWVAHSGPDTLWTNQGGVFSHSGQNLDGGLSFAVALADLDADSDLDGFVANFGGNTVWINQGGLQGGDPGVFFDSGQRLGSANSSGLALGDLDGDGDVDAFVANSGANVVWLNQGQLSASPDDWQIQAVDTRGYSGLSPALALDQNGHAHIAYIKFGPRRSGLDYRLKYARWDGLRWHVAELDSATTVGDSSGLEQMAIAVDTAGQAHIAYSFDSEIRYARDVGAQWQIAILATSSVDGSRAVDLALDANDYPHLVYRLGSIAEYAYWDGTDWQFDYLGNFLPQSLVLDSMDRPHVSFYDDYPGNVVGYARIEDGFWSGQTVENIPLSYEAHTALALDAAGNPLMAFNTTGGNGTAIRFAAWDGSAWDIQTVTLATLPLEIQGRVDMAVGGDGNPHIVYTRQDNATLQYAVTYAAWNGASWENTALDATYLKRPLSALALEAGGNLHVAYYHGRHGDLRYVSRGPDWQIENVAPGPVQSPSLQVVERNPSLGYYDEGSGLVNLARWEQAWMVSAAAFVSTPIQSISQVADFVGNHLSYYDADNQRLMKGRWNGLNWTTEIVDSGAAVGRYNDLIISPNYRQSTRPRIVYWDATNQRIKMAVYDPQVALYTNTVGPPLNAASGFPALAELPDLTLVASYYDGVAGSLRLASLDPGGGVWTDEIIDGANQEAGRLNDIAVDIAAGAPVLAYYDESNDAIKFAYRQDGTFEVSSAVPNAGGVTSLALALGFNSRQHARIAYTTAGNDVRLAILRDGTWTVEIIDQGNGTPRSEVSLALHLRPHVAYVDGADGLQYAFRTATLDETSPVSPYYYNPLNACPWYGDGEDSLPAQAPTRGAGGLNRPGSLGDLAIFSALDTLFAGSAAGRHYRDLYGQHGMEMGQLGLSDLQLMADAAGALQNFLPGLEALVTGRGGDVLVTQEMVDDALDIWQRLAAAGSPELAATINAELAGTNNLQDFVGLSFDEWATALGVSPPARQIYLPLLIRSGS